MHTEAHAINAHTYYSHVIHLLARTNSSAIYLATSSTTAVEAIQGERNKRATLNPEIGSVHPPKKQLLVKNAPLRTQGLECTKSIPVLYGCVWHGRVRRWYCRGGLVVIDNLTTFLAIALPSPHPCHHFNLLL